MALFGAHKDTGETRIHESLDELRTDLADYIAQLSEMSVKERGVFAIALSGGSLIGLMGYQYFPFPMFICFPFSFKWSYAFCLYFWLKSGNCVKLLITRLLIGPSGTYFGLMSVSWVKVMLIAIISWQRMASLEKEDDC